MCLSVNAFCFKLSLEVGAQIIGIVSLLMSAVVAALYSSAVLVLRLSPLRLVSYSCMAGSAVAQFVCACFLLYAAFQRRPKFMWPWLIIVWCTGYLLLVTAMAGTAMLVLWRQLTMDINVIIVVYMVYSLFLLYCAGVVNGRRIELGKELKYLAGEEQVVKTFLRHPNAWKYV